MALLKEYQSPYGKELLGKTGTNVLAMNRSYYGTEYCLNLPTWANLAYHK